MFCTNCGSKITGNQKFCTNCGAKVDEEKKATNYLKENCINTYNKVLSHIVEHIKCYKVIGMSILGAVIGLCILLAIFSSYYYSHLDLEDINIDNNTNVYIDSNGNEHLVLNTEDYSNTSEGGWFGKFTEGRVFFFESLSFEYYNSFKENGKEYSASLGKLKLLNHKGKVIKTFDKNVVSLCRSDVPYESDNYDIYPSTPQFYKGYTRVAFTDKDKVRKLSDINVVYIDRNGNSVKRVPKDVDQAFKQGLRKTKQNIFTKEFQCEDGTKRECIAFTDKDGNQLTKAIYSTSKAMFFKVYGYPHIYHDVTLAYLNKDLTPKYIDKNGNSIYNEPFERGGDFEHILAWVSPQQDDCDDYADYYPSFMINKQGKRVWSDMQPKYIYDIKHKKWIDYDKKRLGNKYLYDCIYLRLYQSRCWEEDEFEDQVIDKDFHLMYGEENMKSLIGDKAPNFNINDLTLNNNRLIYKERYYNKLYELIYNTQTKKVELKEVHKN